VVRAPFGARRQRAEQTEPQRFAVERARFVVEAPIPDPQPDHLPSSVMRVGQTEDRVVQGGGRSEPEGRREFRPVAFEPVEQLGRRSDPARDHLTHQPEEHRVVGRDVSGSGVAELHEPAPVGGGIALGDRGPRAGASLQEPGRRLRPKRLEMSGE
jgi:hypothetical protein